MNELPDPPRLFRWMGRLPITVGGLLGMAAVYAALLIALVGVYRLIAGL